MSVKKEDRAKIWKQIGASGVAAAKGVLRGSSYLLGLRVTLNGEASSNLRKDLTRT